MADFQAIVIGSGAGGLSAALILAKQGFSVLLLEAMPSFGGYLNPFRRGSYTFDTGLHYLGQLGKEEPFWRLLDTLGIADAVDFVELNPDGIDRNVFPDYEFVLAKDKERYEDYKAFKDRIGERLVKAAEKHIPKLSEHLDHVEYATPLSNEYRVNAVRGGCYGPEQSPDQMGQDRFSSFTAGIEGLFLAGAGTIAGGVMPCIASGVQAGRKAAKYLSS